MKYLSYITAWTLCLCLFSCSGKQKASGDTHAGEDDARSARGLVMYQEGDSWVARVIHPADSSKYLGTYIFSQPGVENIPGIPGANYFTPSDKSRIMLYTSVYSSAIKELGAENLITVVGDSQYFTDPYIVEGIKSGRIIDAGSQQEPVAEKIIAAKPDMIILSHYDGMDASKFMKLGIPIVYMRESSEQDPLGRAEWIKMLGAITGKKQKADSIYNKVVAEYSAMSDKASGATKRPEVMTETMYQGTWNVAGGNSYAAKVIADAGGDYIWADDDQAGSLQLPFEAVLKKASKADIWLIRSFGKDLTTKDLEGMDSRYMLFAPAKNGGVWNANTLTVPFFDETPFHPERLLRDYLIIFHPDLMPGQTPRYFKPAK